MKTLLTILMLLILGQYGSAQTNRIDSLINQLDNSQAGLNGDYAGTTIDLRGEPSLSIFNLGKPATEKLISILEDSIKGIIAHILLTWIWEKTERPKSTYVERDTLAVYTYNGLNFFVRPGRIYANPYDLKLNKFRWQAFLRQNYR